MPTEHTPRDENSTFAENLDASRCAFSTTTRTKCETTRDAETGEPRRTCVREFIKTRTCPGRCASTRVCFGFVGLTERARADRAPEELERVSETIEDDGGGAFAPSRGFSSSYSSSWSASSGFSDAFPRFGDARTPSALDASGVEESAVRFLERAFWHAMDSALSSSRDVGKESRLVRGEDGLLGAFGGLARAFASELNAAADAIDRGDDRRGGGDAADAPKQIEK